MRAMPHRGFTLIELLVALAILAFLLVLAAPSYVVWVADSQIRSGADLVAGGLRYAQAEAIRRNAQVQVVIDPTMGIGGWRAELVSDGSLLQEGHFEEAARAQFAVTPVGNTIVTFTGLGFVAPQNNDATAPFDTVQITHSAANSRTLRVLVGGTRTGVKICDPAWAPPDPKACPPLGG